MPKDWEPMEAEAKPSDGSLEWTACADCVSAAMMPGTTPADATGGTVAMAGIVPGIATASAASCWADLLDSFDRALSVGSDEWVVADFPSSVLEACDRT
ncbi:MAG: hypothetical protein ABSE87_01395 [Terracidiphilus sp.]